jgi:hypothetical protein
MTASLAVIFAGDVSHVIVENIFNEKVSRLEHILIGKNNLV